MNQEHCKECGTIYGEPCLCNSAEGSESRLIDLLSAETLEAVEHLYGIGLSCQRCGWDMDKTLWCTEQHKITPKYLLALGSLVGCT